MESGYELWAVVQRPARATGDTILMQKRLLAPLAILLAAMTSARGEEASVGRYQMVAVPASQAQTFPEALLLDTATGQTWMLYHESGRTIQWVPLPFLSAKDRPVFLPPPPDAAGVTR
jgi:hypothetical protein